MPNARVPIREFEEKLKTVSQMDWIRLAAFIDGEGSIFIGRSTRKGGCVQHALEVVVSGTSPLLINWLLNTFGGNAYLSYPNGTSDLGSKICTSWKLFEIRAEMVIRACLPYFIIKRSQADIALAYRDLKRRGVKWQKVTPAVIEQRDALRNQLHILNSPKFAVKIDAVMEKAS